MTTDDLIKSMDKANAGDAWEQYILAQYFDGKDSNLYMYWIERAANSGIPGAQYDLGVTYMSGDGGPKSHERAVYWFRRVLSVGKGGDSLIRETLNNLGVCYIHGYGVSQSWQEATQLWRRAAELGCETAQNNLNKFDSPYKLPRPSYTSYHKPKSTNVALALCFFLGSFGGHRFYLGKTGTGVLYLFTCGLVGIGAIVDMFRIAYGKFTDSNGNTLEGSFGGKIVCWVYLAIILLGNLAIWMS